MVRDCLRFVLAYYIQKNAGNFQDNLLPRKKIMNIFKEIGKFPTKNGLNLEEDHYYDLCLFQEEVYKNVGWACGDVCYPYFSSSQIPI